MSSLAASVSSLEDILFPRTPAPAHTLNSRGELGTSVDPYACSCHTCVPLADDTFVGYVPAPAARPPTPPPAPLPLLSPALAADGAATPAPAAPAQVNVGWGQNRVFLTPQSYDDDAMTRLLGLRSRLMDEQKEVLNGSSPSHADAQWKELESKINAIEGVLTAFNVDFVAH